MTNVPVKMVCDLMAKAMAAAVILRGLFPDFGRIEAETVNGRPSIAFYPGPQTITYHVRPGDALRFYMDGMPADATAEEIADLTGPDLLAMLCPLSAKHVMVHEARDRLGERSMILHRVIVRAVNESEYPELMDCELSIRAHGMTFAFFMNCCDESIHGICSALYIKPLDPQAVADAGISRDELLEAARENLIWYFGEKICRGVELLGAVSELNEQPGEPFWRAGFGASVLLYPDMLEQAGDSMKKDFYVVPGSIHTLAFVESEGRSIDTEMLLKEKHGAFCRVQKEVHPEEFLSSSVFFYSRRTGELTEV